MLRIYTPDPHLSLRERIVHALNLYRNAECKSPNYAAVNPNSQSALPWFEGVCVTHLNSVPATAVAVWHVAETTDVVVALPQAFGLRAWMREGDLPGEDWGGSVYYYNLPRSKPALSARARVYVCYRGFLIGYSPLLRIEDTEKGCALVRGGNAQAVTIRRGVPSFHGWRYRDWKREDEIPFPEWRHIDDLNALELAQLREKYQGSAR